MTQPTQAQIDAFRQLITDYEDVPDATDANGQAVIQRAKKALDEITAAAQVGEQQLRTEMAAGTYELVEYTIERCAQVADKRAKAFCGDGQREIEAIAHAIRKLKDAPCT